MQRKWTKDEEEYLRKWYGKKTTEEIKNHLNRTVNSVRRKADSLGITDVSNKIRGTEWKELELKYLKKWYGKKSISEIAKKLNRTKCSVQGKATRLGLADSDKKQDSKPWTLQEELYLEKMYYKRSSEYIASKLNRTIYSVRRKAQNLSLNIFQGEEVYVKTISNCFNVDSSVIKRWINQFELPCRKTLRGENEFISINIETFWKWAFTHQDIIPWNKYDYLSLLPQPNWVDDTIKKYKARLKNHCKPITYYDKSTVARMLRQKYNYNDIALELGRTISSVKHISNDIKEG